MMNLSGFNFFKNMLLTMTFSTTNSDDLICDLFIGQSSSLDVKQVLDEVDSSSKLLQYVSHQQNNHVSYSFNPASNQRKL